MGLALVLAYIALNLLSPADMIPALNPFRPMLILAVLNVPAVIMARMQAPAVGKLHVQFILVLLFFGFACSALIPHRLYGANLETFTELLPNVLAYFLGIVHFRSPQRLRIVRAMLIFVALFVLVNGLLELRYASAAGVDTPYVLAQGYTRDTMQFRIRGLGMLHDPNTYGQFVLLVLPLLFIAKNDGGLGPGWLGTVPISLLFVFAVYLTGSRGAVLGLVVILGLYFTTRLPKVVAIILTILGGTGALAINAFGTRAISLSGGMDRLGIWSSGLSYFKRSPVWGIGPRNFVQEFGMTAHNSFLLVAAELGLVGLFLWVAMSLVTIIQLNKIARLKNVSGEIRRWAIGLKISLAGYLFTSFFLSRTYELPLYMLLGMCGGIIIAAGGDEAAPLRGTFWPVWTTVFAVGVIALIYALLRLRFA
jgi:putative inorganic carbon (HCO3(-)) transporter